MAGRPRGRDAQLCDLRPPRVASSMPWGSRQAARRHALAPNPPHDGIPPWGGTLSLLAGGLAPPLDVVRKAPRREADPRWRVHDRARHPGGTPLRGARDGRGTRANRRGHVTRVDLARRTG